MTPGMIGALVGLFFGVASWRAMNLLSQRVEKDETKRLLRIVGGIELILLPAIGYMVGDFVFGPATDGATA
jgi:sulfite exporter TauE/SafE